MVTQRGPLPTERTELIREIQSVRFAHTRFQRGYAEDAVDRLLDDVVASLGNSLAQPSVLASRVRGLLLPTTRWRAGYRAAEVDVFRSLVADAVEQLPATGPSQEIQRATPPGTAALPGRERWRDRPRRTMLRWDPGRELLLYTLALVTLWGAAAGSRLLARTEYRQQLADWSREPSVSV